MSASVSATDLRKGSILTKRGRFARVVSTGKTGIKVQYRNGTRGRYGNETEELTDVTGWKLVNGDE